MGVRVGLYWRKRQRSSISGVACFLANVNTYTQKSGEHEFECTNECLGDCEQVK
jgi:hypothetical protein